MNSGQAVIRADASAGIGGGHVTRCLALADVLSLDGWNVSFASIGDALDTVSALRTSSYPFVRLNNFDDPAELDAAFPSGCDLFVVDHYGLGEAYESNRMGWAKKLVVVDDLARPHCCDILVDPIPGFSVAISNQMSRVTTTLKGANYALLGQEFARLRRPPHAKHSIERIYVSFGASDTANILAPLVDKLGVVFPNAAIDVVVGRSAKTLDAIKASAAKHPRVFLHVDTDKVASLMCAADLAIIGAGGTAWEAACIGLPMILVPVADNQHVVTDAMTHFGAAVVCSTIDDAVRQAMRLVAEYGTRRNLASKAMAICDGRGANRVAISIAPERTSDGRSLALKPVVLADSQSLLDLQRQPDTRRFSRNPKVPTSDQHDRWLQAKLSDPSCLLNLITIDNESVGMLRLDRIEQRQPSYEISIAVASGWHRKGVASAALRSARRLVPEAGLSAEIMSGNDASFGLFAKAAFQKTPAGRYLLEPLIGAVER